MAKFIRAKRRYSWESAFTCLLMRFCKVRERRVSQTFDVMKPVIALDEILIYPSEGKEIKLNAFDIFEPQQYEKEFILDDEGYMTALKELGDKTVRVQNPARDAEDPKKYTKKETIVQLS